MSTKTQKIGSESTFTKIQNGNYPKLCFQFEWVNSYDVSKEELVNNGVLFGTDEEIEQSMKELQNGTHTDKFLNCKLVHQFVGKNYGTPIPVSFCIHPIGVKVNENNTIDFDFHLSSTKEIYDNEMMSGVMQQMLNNIGDTIISEASDELDIKFTPNTMNVKAFILNIIK